MSKKIKKANIIHSILYRTYPDSTMLRYSISLLFSGAIFLVLSFISSNENFNQALVIFSEISAILSFYVCPFWTSDDANKALSTFLKWLGMVVLAVLYSTSWYIVCNSIQYTYFWTYLIMIFGTIEEFALILILFDLMIKSIQNVLNTVSQKMQNYAQQKKESNRSIAIKKALANSSAMITFFAGILSIIKLLMDILTSCGVFGE
ncbi:MAG: hypothetical protein ACI4KH_00805 [Oscillospiraceae bacterium]